LEYPFVNLPDHFTALLCVNMQSSGKNFNGLDVYFSERKALKLQFFKLFSDIDNSGNIDKVVKSLGWHGVRDRFACLYIENLINGEFPETVVSGNCYGLLGFEDKLKAHSIGGFSRGFLLGFYLKMASLELSLKGDSSANQLMEMDDVYDVLALSNARTVKIDLLALLIKHLIFFLGKQEIMEGITGGKKYKDFYELLSDTQKSLLMNNFLSYGSSINEKELFVSNLI